MDYTLIISLSGTFIIGLLGIIAFFIRRFVSLQDEATKDFTGQFNRLITELKTLNATVFELKLELSLHKNDVVVIREQIELHAESIKEFREFNSRLRIIEMRLDIEHERRAPN